MNRVFQHGLLAAALIAVSPFVAAQDYPVRPIRMVVPFAPGGGSDISGRILAEGLHQALGQNVVVDNRAGAGSTIGADIVSKASPDGYTLLLGNISMAFNAALYKKLPYDTLRDFTPVSLVVEQPNIIVAHPSLPAKTLKEFIALARSTPGKLAYGSAGVGSGTHLAMEMLLLTLKIDMVHVPYKGTGPALTALLGNEISVFLSTFASALPHVKSGRLHTFGVTSAKRASALPGVPTVAEAGVPGFEYSTWYGLLVPGGTPHTIVEKLNKATVGLLNSPEIRQRYLTQGMEPIPSTSADYAARLKSEMEKWAKVVHAANIPQQ
ncbi:MAG: tripartite tricarboxylate transporter substrate binding protein [Burkholderiales bacterium]|nr:tripartite tricarboxylate transporter substrate binding protein [Burkholderiales bacterium]